MNTTEIVTAFMKGGTKVTITQKQKDWLERQARYDNVRVDGRGVFFADRYYSIRNCRRMASGGSYVTTKVIPGKYNMEVMYLIRFNEPPHMTRVADTHELEHFKSEGHTWTILDPSIELWRTTQ